MSVRSGQSVTVEFTTRVWATGVGTNADSTPTGTLYLNGTADGATVTVTNISTGLYKAQVTLPTLAVGDEVQIVITATVSTIADKAVIWGDTKDVFAGAVPDVAAGAASGLALVGSAMTLANGSIVTATFGTCDFTSTMKTSIGTAVAASAVASVTGNVGGNVVGSVGSVTGMTASDVGAIKAKTDNLPTDPADESLIIAATDAIMTRIGTAGAGLTALGDTRIANLDATVSSRLASAGYTAPDNAGIAAIKAKTDSLTFTTAGFVDANVQYVNDVEVDGTGTAIDPWGPV